MSYLVIWLPNRIITAELEPVLSDTEKCCIVLYNQFSTSIKIYNHSIQTSFIGPCLRHLKNSFNLIIVHLYLRGKLFIIQCNAINNYSLTFLKHIEYCHNLADSYISFFLTKILCLSFRQ